MMRKIFIKLKIVSRLYSYVYCTIFLCAGENLINFVGFLSRSTRSFFFVAAATTTIIMNIFSAKVFHFLEGFCSIIRYHLNGKCVFCSIRGFSGNRKKLKLCRGLKKLYHWLVCHLKQWRKHFPWISNSF